LGDVAHVCAYNGDAGAFSRVTEQGKRYTEVKRDEQGRITERRVIEFQGKLPKSWPSFGYYPWTSPLCGRDKSSQDRDIARAQRLVEELEE